MPAPIIIRVELAPTGVSEAGTRAAQQFADGVNGGLASLRESGRKMVAALDSGAREALSRATQLRQQLDAALSPERRHLAHLAAERAHQNKLSEIRERSAHQQAVIASRAAAQFNAVHARTEVAEIRHQQRLREIQERSAGRSPGLGAGLLAGLSGAAIIGTLTSIGRSALDAAVGIDKSRQTLVALTGSAEAANKKLAELRQLAQASPGLTASVATEAYAQLRAVGNIADQTINRVLQATGRLNAVFTIDDTKGFTRNLVQIFQQSFERSDIKEALGRVPIFEQILESAFGTRDASKLRQLKEAGKLTLDTYLSGLAGAISSNPALANVAESIGSRLEKARDNALLALAPLGDELANLILPVLTRISGGAGTMAGDIAAELRRSRDEFAALTDSAAFFGSAVARALGNGIGVGFDLKKELRDLRSVIDFTTGGVVLLQDVFEIFGAVARGAVQGVALVIESALAGALGLIGIKVESLENSMRRLGFGIATADARVSAGLKNTEAFYNRNRQAQALGALDAGNAVPVDLRTGRPVNPSDYLPFRAGGSFGGNGSGGRTGGGAGRSDAQRQLEEAARAREALVKSQQENELKVIQQALRQQQDLLRANYEQGIVSTRDYYDNRLLLTARGMEAELSVLQRQQAALEEALGTAKRGTPERIKLEERLNDTLTQQFLKLDALRHAQLESIGEFRKAVGELKSGLDLSTQLEVISPQNVPEVFRRVREERAALTQQAAQFEVYDAALRVDEVRIQNQVNQGVLTEVEGRRALLGVQAQSRDVMIAALEAQRQIAASSRETDPFLAAAQAANVSRITEQIEQLRGLGVELSNSQRFMRGFGSEIEDAGDIFERFGQNVANSFRSVKDIFSSLRDSFKQLVGDLLSNTLQNALRSTFGALFGNGQRQQPGSVGNASGFNLGSLFGGLFGGGGQRGGLGSFLTPTFAGSSAASGPNLLNVLQSLSGGGLQAPPSISQRDALGITSLIQSRFGGRGNPVNNNPIAQLLNGGGQLGGGGFLNRISGGLTGGGAVSLLPALLGGGLGASLGGQSGIGQLLGLAGGSAVGLGVSFGASVFAAGGGLAAAGLAALGPAAILGAPLLIASLLFSRAQQRRRDEEQSGVWLQEAVDNVFKLRDAAKAGQLTDVEEARKIFETNIIGQFASLINTLRTESVRTSRLTNQVRDLRGLFNDHVIPHIKPPVLAPVIDPVIAAVRQINRVNIIPEFHIGGVSPREQIAKLLSNEMVLTATQQHDIIRRVGYNVFDVVGVPDAGKLGRDGLMRYHEGAQRVGVAPLNIGPSYTAVPYIGSGYTPAQPTDNRPIHISLSLDAQLAVSREQAGHILQAGATTDDGRHVIVNIVQRAKGRREI